MTRSGLIEKLLLQYPLFEKEAMAVIIKEIIEIMREALRNGDRIEIRGFGSFHVRHRQKRVGRNPKTGAKVFIPEKKVPFFKAGKELRRQVDH